MGKALRIHVLKESYYRLDIIKTREAVDEIMDMLSDLEKEIREIKEILQRLEKKLEEKEKEDK